jgi:hypothetical protein
MLSGDCSFAFKTAFRAPSGPYRFGHHPRYAPLIRARPRLVIRFGSPYDQQR